MCTLEFKKLALQAVAPGARFPHRANRNRMTNQAIGTVLIVAGEKTSGRYFKCFVSGGYLHRQASVQPRESAHRNVASNNLRRLQRINSQEVRVSLRVEGDRAPERLQIAADEAARSGDLRTTIEYASGARHAIRLWDEFRVWDPGD